MCLRACPCVCPCLSPLVQIMVWKCNSTAPKYSNLGHAVTLRLIRISQHTHAKTNTQSNAIPRLGKGITCWPSLPAVCLPLHINCECIYPCTHLCVLSHLAQFPLMHPNGPREPGSLCCLLLVSSTDQWALGLQRWPVSASPFRPTEPWPTPQLKRVPV